MITCLPVYISDGIQWLHNDIKLLCSRLWFLFFLSEEIHSLSSSPEYNHLIHQQNKGISLSALIIACYARLRSVDVVLPTNRSSSPDNRIIWYHVPPHQVYIACQQSCLDRQLTPGEGEITARLCPPSPVQFPFALHAHISFSELGFGVLCAEQLGTITSHCRPGRDSADRVMHRACPT